MPRILFWAAIFGGAFLLFYSQAKDPPSEGRLEAKPAIAAALGDPIVARELEAGGYDRARAVPLDEKLERVSFFAGSRIVLEVAVSPEGEVVQTLTYGSGFVRSGSDIAQDPPLLLLLFCAVFAFATLRTPIRSWLTVDVSVLLAFTLQAVLINQRYFLLSVICASVCLVYLAARCAYVGLSPPAVGERGPTLIELAMRKRLEIAQLRPLAIGTAAMAVILVLISIPGGFTGDVGLASMEGATKLTEGVLPYGNLSGDAVHGDTYPLLAYAAYIPAAVISPVQNAFSNLEGALYIATAAALLGAAGMCKLALNLSGRRRDGFVAALMWLAFPPLLLSTSSGANDVPVAAVVVWALALSAYAASSTGLLAVASWMKVLPVFVLPLWIARNRGRMPRVLVAVLIVTVACLAWLVIWGGAGAVGKMIEGLSFQSKRGSPLALWYWLEWPLAQAAVQAAALFLILFGSARVWNDERLASDPVRICALSAAGLLLLLFGARYFTWSYLPWVFPFLAVALLLPVRNRLVRS